MPSRAIAALLITLSMHLDDCTEWVDEIRARVEGEQDKDDG